MLAGRESTGVRALPQGAKAVSHLCGWGGTIDVVPCQDSFFFGVA